MNYYGKKKYLIADMDKISTTPCPCGMARRAFIELDNKTTSFHIVDISKNSRPHFHKTITKIYYVLEGKGILKLDADRVELSQGIAVLIQPGCIHRAVGKLKLINVPIPAFDPLDEWFPKSKKKDT